MLVEIQFDKSSFELRSNAVQSFLNVPIAVFEIALTATQHIGGHSVHQCAYLWWSGINFGGPKKYAITKNSYNNYFTR